MANNNQPNGLKPHGELIRARKYVAGSTVYPGDPVSLATDGQVDPSITVPLIGVALHYATAGENVMIADHPDQMFEVQADGAVATTDINGNYDLVLGSPSTTYKRSACYVDAATADNTTATLAVKVLSIGDAVNNSANAAYNDVIVKINNHSLNGGTGTAGLA